MENDEVTTVEAPPIQTPHPLAGTKKKRIRQDCPFCDYKSEHPPGLAHHIKGTHPEHWKGNLGESLGGTPSRAWKNRKAQRKAWDDRYRAKRKLAQGSRYENWLSSRQPKSREQLRATRRAYQKRLREQRRAQGLNTKGEPYKQPNHYTVRALRGPRGPYKKHTGGRPPAPRTAASRTCPLCSKRFSTRPNMTLHLRKVHNRSITEFEAVDQMGRDQSWRIRGGEKVEEPAKPGLPRNGAPQKRESTFNPLGVNFCPRCGCNMRNVSAAVQFGETP